MTTRRMSEAFQYALDNMSSHDRARAAAALSGAMTRTPRIPRLDALFQGLIVELAIADTLELSKFADLEQQLRADRDAEIAQAFPDGVPPLPPPPISEVRVERDTP